ncbi:MAG: hypothetical protein EXR59_00770 [Dehalococcoidia bacterium]|nr:hypothetical protein [Dehalococcoidia bacterium]
MSTDQGKGQEPKTRRARQAAAEAARQAEADAKKQTASQPNVVYRVASTFGPTSLLLAFIGIVALAAAGVTYLISPDELRTSAIILASIGGFFILLFIFAAYSQIRATVTGRSGRYGANTFVMIGAFLGIITFVNFIAGHNSFRYDATANKQLSLAPQTIKVVEELPENVDVVAFFNPDDALTVAQADSIRDLLTEYKRRSDKFSFRFVDPDARPTIARQLGVTSVPTIAFATTSRAVHVPLPPPGTTINPSERDFTTALLIVTGQQQKKIYFLTGHGERDPDDTTKPDGFGIAKSGLLSDNYAVETLSLATQETSVVPNDTSVIVIAGPKKDLSEVETAALFSYLTKGGKIMFLLEPNPPAAFKDLLFKYAIGFARGAVVDPASSLKEDRKSILLAAGQFADDSITNQLNGMLLSGSTEVHRTIEKDKATLLVKPLLQSTGSSWQESDALEENFDRGLDKPGPLTVGVVVNSTAPIGQEDSPIDPNNPTRMIVIGDADFAANRFYAYRSNSDMFLNSINWLAQDTQLISIRPKPVVFRQLVVNRREWNVIRFSSWLLMPIGVAIVGGYVWWRRR